jgi:hypothetical protein
MSELLNTKTFKGFFKIWKTHKDTGVTELVVDQPNKILYQGADLLAYALGGIKYAKISHVYVGFSNYDDEDVFDLPIIDKNYNTLPFSSYGVEGGDYEDYGYFRLPLSYTPTFQASSTDYEHNTVVFTTIMSFDASPSGQSAEFQFADNPTTQSHLFEVGLAAALDPTTTNKDQFFSRATFTPIMFDPSYNLTISWGIQFLS